MRWGGCRRTHTRELTIISGEEDSFLDSADVLDTQDISDSIKGDWGGYSFAASVSAGRQFEAGSFYARPEVSVDYFRLHQDGYREAALRNSSLALEVSEADTERASASAILAIGADWSIENGLYRVFPEARIGVRHELLETPYEVTARFLEGEESFLIQSQEEFGNALIAGFSFNSSSSIFTARASYDVELSEAGAVHYIGASGTLRF
ncbi:MAG: autotransporter domain-containing protein [Hyphomonas sp.]